MQNRDNEVCTVLSKERMERYSMRDKIQRFMQGRYGVDAFSRFLIMVGMVLAVISMLGKWTVFYILAWILLLLAYLRMFSRNYAKRAAENQTYLRLAGKLRAKWNSRGRRGTRDKQYHIYKCPECKQKIRIPRGHGKVEIRCPKCGRTFVKRS